MSKLKVNELDTESGTTITVTTGKTVDIPVGATITVAGTANLTSSTLTLPATLPATAGTNITNLPGANVTGTLPANTLVNAPAFDDASIQDDIAVLGFQVAAASDLAQYNLRDQIVNTFQTDAGVDTSASTGETRNSAGKYWQGSALAADVQVAFTASGAGTWSAPSGLSNFRLLVVGGGGSGGTTGWSGGAGGAGGLVYISDWQYLGGATVNYTIGGGGAIQNYPPNGLPGLVGADTVWDSSSLHQTITATGGGGGQARPATTVTAGGSGGGGAVSDTASQRLGGTSNQPVSFGVYTSVGHGYDGGDTDGAGGPYYQSAGGGGAGGVAPDVTSSDGASRGHGGAAWDGNAIFGAAVGDSGWFAGGGGGAGHSGRVNDGGYANGGDQTVGVKPGGGGNGDNYSGTTDGGPGTANTGGGAGGKRNDSTGYGGGSGVIIIKYASSTFNDMVLQSDATTAEAGTTATGDLVILYTPFAGTTTINTDLVAAVSRDNGTTFTNVTLVDKGSYSGTTEIATAHNIDLSGQPAGVAMKWKISTTTQSVSKQTRINGVSLGWA